MISRRDMLTATATGAMVTAATSARAATFGDPDEPPQGAINAKNPKSLTDPGPQSPALGSQFPSAQSLRRRPTWETCHSFGRRSITRQSAFRTAVGRAR
jgi:hypothetical protein